jgi:uncharacterized protein YraI
MRLLLCFLVLAGLLYAGHTLLFGGGQGGSSDQASPVAVSTSPSSQPAQQLAAEHLTPSPAGSRHAIEVEHAPLPSPSETSAAASQATPPGASPDASLGPDQPAFVTVTSPASIREGPSTSAAIIGVAQPGAEAQIVSRSTDWVEIIDPASRKTGWIHQSFVAPQAEPSSRPVPPEEMASLAETEEDANAGDDDQQPSLRSKSRKHASRHRHRHTLVLGPFILRFR